MCAQMETFRYLMSVHYRSSSQAAIDANAPLNSTLKTLTLKVRTIERASLAAYFRLLLSVRHMIINSIFSSMNEVKSKVDMLLGIYDGLSDKTRYLVDIEHENGARREWTEAVNGNPLIKVSVKVGLVFLLDDF
ncbi:hypothetical protein BCV72DRAFT_244177 [Rhizopus microsporus var. microsporus]|uniref:Uncharacterized protein n=2 Tax=Rhizopus microsporus TaxID=58291 RepID=A0A2G4T4Z2_RHIZD|nr:uncharacterized protein RHIMIDRAFT_300527 [Rhizopus microsporus ATCC 52813]ORE03698.1 hypothetical protein BCV72DRAFT_244177 [Rhizopus microsporus var. microsporus]PHZ16081.1 hypothetical protein RHIMIDRAFT_300527 [Rhizopus microsporus ATCC 52813]